MPGLMGHRRTRFWLRVLFVACAATLTTIGASADCESQETKGYVSPGVLLSFAFNQSTSFGLGAEVSYNRATICRTSSDLSGFPTGGFGAFVNGVYYVGSDYYARLAAGGQANALLLGAEAGWSYVTAMSGSLVTGPASGPYLGAFASAGYLMVAVRGTFSLFGDERAKTLSLDLGIKAPISLSSR